MNAGTICGHAKLYIMIFCTLKVTQKVASMFQPHDMHNTMTPKLILDRIHNIISLRVSFYTAETLY